MSITFLMYISYIIMASWYKDMISSSYIIASPMNRNCELPFQPTPMTQSIPQTDHFPTAFSQNPLQISTPESTQIFVYHSQAETTGWAAAGEIAVCLSVFIMTWCFSEKKWKKAMWISLDMDIARATHKENWFLMKHDFKKKTRLKWIEMRDSFKKKYKCACTYVAAIGAAIDVRFNSIWSRQTMTKWLRNTILEESVYTYDSKKHRIRIKKNKLLRPTSPKAVAFLEFVEQMRFWIKSNHIFPITASNSETILRIQWLEWHPSGHRVVPAADWTEIRKLYQRFKCYIHGRVQTSIFQRVVYICLRRM